MRCIILCMHINCVLKTLVFTGARVLLRDAENSGLPTYRNSFFAVLSSLGDFSPHSIDLQ
jgi:hypothetical protein